MASNGREVDELEANCRGLFEVLSQHLPRGTDETIKDLDLDNLVSRSRYEPSSSRIQVSATQTCSVPRVNIKRGCTSAYAALFHRDEPELHLLHGVFPILYIPHVIFRDLLLQTSGNARRCSGGSQN
jgi:hypothetical protein